MDRFGTGMVKFWSNWINIHAVMEVKNADFYQEGLFWLFRPIFHDQGNICFECCRELQSFEICCLQMDCKVKFLDAYMYKRHRDLKIEYGLIEQRVTEMVMRGHELIAKHPFESSTLDMQTIGP